MVYSGDWGKLIHEKNQKSKISWHCPFEVNSKAKIYIYVYSTTQRCPYKIIKILQLKGFFHLPLLPMTTMVHFELQISPQIYEKIWNGPNGILRGLGETDSWKKPEVENHVTLSLYRDSEKSENILIVQFELQRSLRIF